MSPSAIVTDFLDTMRSQALLFSRAFVFLLFSFSALASASDGAATEPKLEPFTAKFALYYKWLHLGYGEYQLQTLPNGQYRFSFSSSMSVFFYKDKRYVSSLFTLENNRLIPLHYQHQRSGSGDDYSESIEFNKASQLITIDFPKIKTQIPYEAGVYDGLLVQLQLMLDVRAGLDSFTYRIVMDERITEQAFTKVGSKALKVKGKKYQTLQFVAERTTSKKRLKSMMWFAQELNFSPVQLEHYSQTNKQKKLKKQFSAKLVKFTGPEWKSLQKSEQ